MGSKLTITTPSDYDLTRDVCSYGYFVLAPNHWDTKKQLLTRPLNLDTAPATVVLSQTNRGKLKAEFDRTLERAEQTQARAQISRLLRLNEDESHSKAFHKADPRWKKSGRARLFRSATLFEDVIKTVTSCNVAWPSTVNMNKQMCRHLSKGGCFPTAARMSRTRIGTLRGRCRVGYRDQRILDLAKLFHKGEIDEAWLESPSTNDADVFEFLKTLPGIGPYAAGNIMMLLGRYSRLAIDTETIRHGKAALGMTGTDRQITKKLEAHYEPFGEFKFKSYWFELWTFYESKQGPSESWDREETATAFTAANF
jgi:3-methyladenine DNA glycosylase/8-oxoguanine DNA glycosylase